MLYWMVKFESYAGQGNAVAWFETEEAAVRVYDDAVKTLTHAHVSYMANSKDQQWIGVPFSVTDCFGTRFTINLSNHVIALNSTDASQESNWKTWRSNKDAENKWKPLYEEGAKIGIGS